jgi:ribosomal-protein-alanine N-acetyltransferase
MIRTLESRDVDAILAIQASCPEIAQWTAWDYERVAEGEMAGWVAEEVTVHDSARVAGFMVARRVTTDLEILNFAVAFGSRRRGLGARLLQTALAWAQSFQGTQAILEVRASNIEALRFYERHKFRIVGRRPRYYAGPVEDAILLTATLI